MKDFNQIFPAEIISDILSRLPVESVLESKLVCKTWKTLIRQPSFPQIHLNHLNRLDSASIGKLSYVFLDSGDDIDNELFHFELNQDWNNNPVKPIRTPFETGTLELDDHSLIGSFNGLVCVYGTEKKYDAMIINPVTKQYVVLPKFKTKQGKSSYEHLACGFGYLDETNEYKVVRVYRRRKNAQERNVVEVEVYTVGSGEGWRHVGKFDLGFKFGINGEDRDGYEQVQGVFWNGCLCWRNVKGGMVVVFDLADEEFREPIPPPRVLTDDDDDEDGNMVLGVSNAGILYYTVCLYGQQEEEEEEDEEEDEEENHINEVWLLMRGQEEKQPWVWSKPLSLEQREPFAFKEQNIVLRFEKGKIKECSSYNSNWGRNMNSTWRSWTDIGEFSEISRRVFPHKHTLISLKELGEEGAKIMQRYPEYTEEDIRRMCYDF